MWDPGLRGLQFLPESERRLKVPEVCIRMGFLPPFLARDSKPATIAFALASERLAASMKANGKKRSCTEVIRMCRMDNHISLLRSFCQYGDTVQISYHNVSSKLLESLGSLVVPDKNTDRVLFLLDEEAKYGSSDVSGSSG